MQRNKLPCTYIYVHCRWKEAFVFIRQDNIAEKITNSMSSFSYAHFSRMYTHSYLMIIAAAAVEFFSFFQLRFLGQQTLAWMHAVQKVFRLFLFSFLEEICFFFSLFPSSKSIRNISYNVFRSCYLYRCPKFLVWPKFDFLKIKMYTSYIACTLLLSSVRFRSLCERWVCTHTQTT